MYDFEAKKDLVEGSSWPGRLFREFCITSLMLAPDVSVWMDQNGVQNMQGKYLNTSLAFLRYDKHRGSETTMLDYVAVRRKNVNKGKRGTFTRREDERKQQETEKL